MLAMQIGVDPRYFLATYTTPEPPSITITPASLNLVVGHTATDICERRKQWRIHSIL